MAKDKINCAKCPAVKKACWLENGIGPEWCPTMKQKERIGCLLETYFQVENNEFARNATIQEGECYTNRDRKPYIVNPTKTRVEEIIEFSKKMGYIRIGVAFCGGMHHEAALFTGILEKHGFDTISVTCKVGGIPKEIIGIKEEEKIFIGEFEPLCNPIAQAAILNEAKTEFNIMLGLCVGHDSLFLKYIEKPTTILAVKDRVTCHNPLAALYTSNSYYMKLKKSS